MKLIDILLAADFEWDEEHGFAAQDSDGEAWLFLDKPRLMGSLAPAWLASSGESIALADDLASDWRTSVITRAEYLAARDAAKPKGHPHAEIMAEYAEVARTNPEPWLEFQTRTISGDWVDLTDSPSWYPSSAYLRKPRTIRIGEYDVPEPVREPLEHGQRYFAVVLWADATVLKCKWTDDSFDSRLLKKGLVHMTRGAAELHAEALLSLTQQ